MAHARDTRALAPLLRLLRQDEDSLDAVFGDAVSATLAKVLASLFDGDPAPFFRLILDSTADDFVRMALLSACTFLTLEGRIDRAAMRDLLVRFDDAQAGRRGGAGLDRVGRDDRASRLPRSRAAGCGGPGGRTHHRRDQRCRLVQGGPAQGRDQAGRPGPPRTVPVRLSGRSGRSAKLDGRGAGEPQRNPFKDVGRNDPCPCGSGKKFKKCCLGKPEVEGPWMPPGPLFG